MDSNERQQDYSQLPPYEQLYLSLLSSSELRPLSSYHQRFPKEVFPTAIKYPSFFNYNLVSNGRVIKMLTGRKAILKAFYYQLMKLTFQLQIPERDYVQIIKRVFFDPDAMEEGQQENQYHYHSPRSGKRHPEIQDKKILAEFIEMLTSQSPPNFEMSINQYPIVDLALEETFTHLVRRSQEQLLTNQDVLVYLSELFEISFTPINNCYKFEESDVFLYEEAEDELYMAFLSQMEEMQENQDNSEQQNSQEQQSKLSNDIINDSQNKVTKTVQIAPTQPQQPRHNYSNSQPHFLGAHQEQQEQYDGEPEQTEIPIVTKGNLSGKDNTIMNMLGDTYKFGSGSQFEGFQQGSHNPTSDHRVSEQHPKWEKSGARGEQNRPSRASVQVNQNLSEVEKYDGLSSSIKHNQPEPAKEFQPVTSFTTSLKARNLENLSTDIGKALPKYYESAASQEQYKTYPSPRTGYDTYNDIPTSKPFSKTNIQREQIRSSNERQYNSGIASSSPNFHQLSSSKLFDLQSQLYRNKHYETELISKQQMKYFPITGGNLMTYPPPQQQPLIYKPKRVHPQLQTISELSASVENGSTANNKNPGKSPFGLNFSSKKQDQLKDDTKGTFYRQFTNTKILELVKQPHKTKVQLMKNRFIGVRSRNYVVKP